jgi:hypothetical protein
MVIAFAIQQWQPTRVCSNSARCTSLLVPTASHAPGCLKVVSGTVGYDVSYQKSKQGVRDNLVTTWLSFTKFCKWCLPMYCLQPPNPACYSSAQQHQHSPALCALCFAPSCHEECMVQPNMYFPTLMLQSREAFVLDTRYCQCDFILRTQICQLHHKASRICAPGQFLYGTSLSSALVERELRLDAGCSAQPVSLLLKQKIHATMRQRPCLQQR